MHHYLFMPVGLITWIVHLFVHNSVTLTYKLQYFEFRLTCTDVVTKLTWIRVYGKFMQGLLTLSDNICLWSGTESKCRTKRFLPQGHLCFTNTSCFICISWYFRHWTECRLMKVQKIKVNFHILMWSISFLAALQIKTSLWNGNVWPVVCLRQQFGLATALRSIVGKLFQTNMHIHFDEHYPLRPLSLTLTVDISIFKSNANLSLGPLWENYWR